MTTYFSDQEQGPARWELTELTQPAWRGIAAEVRKRVNDGSFGARYPAECPDGHAYCGTDESSFWDAMAGINPDLIEGQDILYQFDPPPLKVVMRMIEFCWKSVGKPEVLGYHDFYRHHHLKFEIEVGQQEFRETVNDIFQCNRLAYELTEQGNIQRLLEPEVSQTIYTRYQTSDTELNEMLETACRKIVSPNDRERRESLEKLWDAWERIKTLDGVDKKTGVSALLDTVAGSPRSHFRSMLDSEAWALTDIGNKFQIRHSEKNQERLDSVDHVDYLWYRMFSLIRLILRQRGSREIVKG